MTPDLSYVKGGREKKNRKGAENIEGMSKKKKLLLVPLISARDTLETDEDSAMSAPDTPLALPKTQKSKLLDKPFGLSRTRKSQLLGPARIHVSPASGTLVPKSSQKDRHRRVVIAGSRTSTY